MSLNQKPLKLERKDSLSLITEISKIYSLSSISTLTNDNNDLNLIYSNIKRVLLSSNYLFNHKQNLIQLNIFIHFISLVSFLSLIIVTYITSYAKMNLWHWKLCKIFLPLLQVIPHWFFFYYKFHNKNNIITKQMQKTTQYILDKHSHNFSYKFNSNFDIEIFPQKELKLEETNQKPFIMYIINIPSYEDKYFTKLCSRHELYLIDEFYRVKSELKQKHGKIFLYNYIVPIGLHFSTLVYFKSKLSMIGMIVVLVYFIFAKCELNKIKGQIREELSEKIKNDNRILIQDGYYFYYSEYMLSLIRINVLKQKEWKVSEYELFKKKIKNLFEE